MTASRDEHLRNRYGIVRADRIAGSPRGKRSVLFEVEDDPAPPTQGAILYCIADNGAGKRAVRVLFPTGSPVVVATEP